MSESVNCKITLCRSCDGVTGLQEAHRPNTSVVILCIFGKNSLDRSVALVFVPKCLAWAKFTAVFQ